MEVTNMRYGVAVLALFLAIGASAKEKTFDQKLHIAATGTMPDGAVFHQFTVGPKTPDYRIEGTANGKTYVLTTQDELALKVKLGEDYPFLVEKNQKAIIQLPDKLVNAGITHKTKIPAEIDVEIVDARETK
jgi:hypothetical protein